MVAFIDQYRSRYGVEPICAVLPIAPSTYYRCKDLEKNPDKRSHRAKRDEMLESEISPNTFCLQSRNKVVEVQKKR